MFLIDHGVKLDHLDSTGSNLLESAVWLEAWDCALILVKSIDNINQTRILRELEKQEHGFNNNGLSHPSRLEFIEVIMDMTESGDVPNC